MNTALILVVSRSPPHNHFIREIYIFLVREQYVSTHLYISEICHMDYEAFRLVLPLNRITEWAS